MASPGILQHLYKRYGSVRKLAICQGLVRAPYIGASGEEQPIPVALRARLCEILPEKLVRILRGRSC